MKTVAEIAKEIGVTPQAVYKRINNQLKTSLKGSLNKGLKGETLLDVDGERIIKEAFKPVDNQFKQPVDNQFINGLMNQLKVKDEQIAILQVELSKAQEHNQTMTMTLAEITRNSQILLKQSQDHITLIEEKNDNLYTAFTEAAPEEDNKKSVWSKLFKRKG